MKKSLLVGFIILIGWTAPATAASFQDIPKVKDVLSKERQRLEDIQAHYDRTSSQLPIIKMGSILTPSNPKTKQGKTRKDFLLKLQQQIEALHIPKGHCIDKETQEARHSLHRHIYKYKISTTTSKEMEHTAWKLIHADLIDKIAPLTVDPSHRKEIEASLNRIHHSTSSLLEYRRIQKNANEQYAALLSQEFPTSYLHLSTDSSVDGQSPCKLDPSLLSTTSTLKVDLNSQQDAQVIPTLTAFLEELQKLYDILLQAKDNSESILKVYGDKIIDIDDLTKKFSEPCQTFIEKANNIRNGYANLNAEYWTELNQILHFGIDIEALLNNLRIYSEHYQIISRVLDETESVKNLYEQKILALALKEKEMQRKEKTVADPVKRVSTFSKSKSTATGPATVTDRFTIWDIDLQNKWPIVTGEVAASSTTTAAAINDIKHILPKMKKLADSDEKREIVAEWENKKAAWEKKREQQAEPSEDKTSKRQTVGTSKGKDAARERKKAETDEDEELTTAMAIAAGERLASKVQTLVLQQSENEWLLTGESLSSEKVVYFYTKQSKSKLTGKGTSNTPRGSTNTGTWGQYPGRKKGTWILTGTGTITLPDGAIYHGTWGETSPSQGPIWGFIGEGSISFSNGTIKTGTWGPTPDGSWGLMGNATFTFSNGTIETGTWGLLADRRTWGLTGKGTRHDPSGRLETGTWGLRPDGTWGMIIHRDELM